VIILVGNKVDLTERNAAARQVPAEIARRFAEQNKLLFEETSAITTVGIRDVFDRLVQGVYEEKSHITSSCLLT
jgi:predicted GTPase